MFVKTLLHSRAFVILAAALIFFVVGIVYVFAQETESEPAKPWEGCPEYAALKNREAGIGGYAWNPYTGWLANQYREENGIYGVEKKGFEKGTSRGSEIIGSSKAIEPKRKDFGYVCWGETCAEYGNPPVGEYNDDELNPPEGTLTYTKEKPFAELDIDHPQKMCQEIDPASKKGALKQCSKEGGGCEKVFGSCAEGKECEPLYKPCSLLSDEQGGNTPAYCLYPVRGWMKFITLKDKGWVRLSARLRGTSIPAPQRDDLYNITDPGTFNVWEKWGAKLDCTNDTVYRNNREACTRGVLYDPRKKEFYGWAWSPLLKWFSFSGGTLYDTRTWKNPFWCKGTGCTTVHYNTESKRSRWSTRYLGVWVKGIGGNLFSRKGFEGTNPPPGEFNTDYLIVTGKYTEGETKKDSPITGWEGACDDRLLGSSAGCFGVSRKREVVDDQKGKQQRTEVFENIALPLASARVNRTLIKRSTLGAFNIAELLPSKELNPLLCVGGYPNAKRNAYSNCVVRVTDEKTIFGDNASVGDLRNTIFYYEGDFVIGSDTSRLYRKIPNGGSATIVVKGNVFIRRPLTYDSGFVTQANKLASLSWVVLERDTAVAGEPVRPAGVSGSVWNILKETWNKGGNVVIDSCIPADMSEEALNYDGNPAVEHIYDRTFIEVIEDGEKKPQYRNNADAKIVNDIFQNQQVATVAGSFFVQHMLATGQGRGGKGDNECRNLKIKYKTTVEETITNDDGSQSTRLKDDTDATAREYYYDVPLEIRGAVVAQQIFFDRQYRGVNRGSETIINTGRSLVNPSPGMAEFVRSLPLW